MAGYQLIVIRWIAGPDPGENLLISGEAGQAGAGYEYNVPAFRERKMQRDCQKLFKDKN